MTSRFVLEVELTCRMRTTEHADKAPLTKVVVFACVALTVMGHAGGFIDSLVVDSARQVFGSGAHRLRLLTSLLPSSSLAEGMVSWYLIYRFRTFERQMGTARFSMLVVLCFAWAVTARIAALTFLPSVARAGIASGPYELIFALFVYYFRALRCSYR